MHYRLATIAFAGVASAAIAACKSAPTRPGDLAGAPTPRGSVERFLAAVRAQDLQAMGIVWGTKDGPARGTLPRAETEKREVVMANCLANDSASYLDETTMDGGDHQVRFVLFHGSVSRTTTFTTEADSQDRWFVKEIDLRAVHACTVEAGQSNR